MGYPDHSYATNYLTAPYGAEMMNSNVFGSGGNMVNGSDGNESFPPPSPSSQYFLYGALDVPNNNNNSPLPLPLPLPLSFNGRDATTTMLHHAIHPMAMMQSSTENRGNWYQPPIGTGSQSDTR